MAARSCGALSVFIYCLFNEAVTSGYIPLNSRTISTREKMWKEAVLF
jgi:hypothetical protein